MKYLITILFLFGTAQAQDNPPIVYDTIPELIPVVDFTSWYKVYDKTGKLLRTVTSYQNANVPSGGWKSEQEFVNPQRLYLKGYTVYITDTAQRMIAVSFLGQNKQPIPPPYRVCGLSIPIEGLNLKSF